MEFGGRGEGSGEGALQWSWRVMTILGGCVSVFACIPAMSSVSMRGGGWGGLNSLLMSSSGSGGSPLLWRWAFSCCRLWRYCGGSDAETERPGISDGRHGRGEDENKR